MATQIQLRNDTSSVWTSVNPTLAQGEMGVELDTHLAKVGDGVTNWNSLPYTRVVSASYAANSSGGADVSSYLSSSWTGSNTSFFAGTASFAITSSYETYSDISSSWASASISSSYAVNADNAISAAFATSTSYAPVEQEFSSSVSAQFGTKQNTLVVGNTYEITASSAVSASWAPQPVVPESVPSASWASSSISASYAPIEQEFSSSVSSQFGTKQDTLVVGNTYQITASNAVSASWAPFSDNPNAVSASWASSSILADTASRLVYGTVTSDKILLGQGAGQFSIDNAGTVQIGYNAGSNCITSSNSVLIGIEVAALATSGKNAVVIGSYAGHSITGNLDQATLVGVLAGSDPVDLTDATCIGVATKGSVGSIAIGSHASASAYQAVIGDSSITSTVLNGPVTASIVSASFIGNLTGIANTASYLKGQGEITSSLKFYLTTSLALNEGEVYYDNVQRALTVGQSGGVNLQVGQEQLMLVHNKTGLQIDNGQMVQGALSTTGFKPNVKLAIANLDWELPVLGMATQDIPNGEDGFITTLGIVHDLPTTAWGFNEGDVVYCSTTTSGSLVTTEPAYPFSITRVGLVLKKHPTQGEIYIRIVPHSVDAAITSSYALSADLAVSAAYADNCISAAFATSASYAPFSDNPIAVSASWASSSISASYAPMEYEFSSSVSAQLGAKQDTLVVGNTYEITASSAVSASFSDTATSAAFAINATSAAFADNATSAAFADNATSAAFATNATSAAFATNATSAAFADNATSAAFADNATSAAFADNATSAAFADNATSAAFADNATSAAFATNSDTTVSASYALTASYTATTEYASTAGVADLAIVANVALSATPIYGGITSYITASNKNDGTIVLTTGSVSLYDDNTGYGTLTQYQLESKTFTITSDESLYIVAEHSGSGASYKATADSNYANGLDIVRVFAFNANEKAPGDWEIHELSVGITGLGLPNRTNNKDIELYGFQRQSGLTLFASASVEVPKDFGITAGVVWYGPNKHPLDVFLSSDSGSCDTYRLSFSGSGLGRVWTQSDVVGYSVNHYNGPSGAAPLAPDSCSVNFIYRLVTENASDVCVVLTDTQYPTLVDAVNNAQPPADLPPIITDMSILVGFIATQSGSTNKTIQSAYNILFAPATVTDHNNLLGLQGGQGGEYNHLTDAEYVGTGTGVFLRSYKPEFQASTPYHIPYWGSDHTLTLTGSVQVYGGNSVLINSGSPNLTNPEALLVQQTNTTSENTIGAYAEVNDFSQIYNQNFSSGSNASTDIVATSDVGGQTSHYIDMGIGSSQYADSRWPWVKPLDGYLQMDGGDLWLATVSDNKLNFVFNNTASTSYADKTGFYLTGSLYGTASMAVSASSAPIDLVYSASISSELGTKQPNLITGNTYTITSSVAVSSSYAPVETVFSSSVSSELETKQTTIATGSSFNITSSQATSASYAVSSSWSDNSATASFLTRNRVYQITASSAQSSSVAVTSSYVAMSYATAALQTAVTMSAANLWYDLVGVSLTAGTWLVGAYASFYHNNANVGTVVYRINDTATVYAATDLYMPNTNPVSVHGKVGCIVTLAAGAAITASALTSAGTQFVRSTNVNKNTGSVATQIWATKLQ